MKYNKRVVTKIELSRLEKLKIGTNEIERLAKKIYTKEGKKKRNEKNVQMILKKRLKDAIVEEKKAKENYEKHRKELLKNMRIHDGKSKTLWKTFENIKKETMSK